MTQQMVLRKIIRRRGYLVLVQANFQSPFAVGDLVPVAGAEGFNLGKPLKVLRHTSERDFLTQQQMSRRLAKSLWAGGSATGHLRDLKKLGAPLKFWRVKPTMIKQSAGQAPIPSGQSSETGHVEDNEQRGKQQ